MEFEGKITYIGDVKKVGDKGHQVREFVVEETNGEYPNSCAFTLFWEQHVGKINKFKAGDVVHVSANLKTREYNGRYFTNINAWRIQWLMEPSSDELPDNKEDQDLPF